MQLGKTLSLGAQDIFSAEVIGFVLKVGLGSIVAWVGVLYIYWGEFLTIISSYLGFIPWEWLKTTGSAIATLLVGYMFIIITISILTSLYSEPLLKSLAKKHYGIEATGSPNPMTSIIINIKASLVFMGLFMLLLALLFVPILGQIVMLYLWSILLREPTIYDVGTLFVSDKERLKDKSKRARVLAMIASLFNYIPVLNIFAAIYAQILFMHHILND
ncbi:MAG: EI24 domain-containing protein [Campylobacterota bacterium]|nr:EI24 domain-containing protein [Campylobacterota bacterium]